MLPPPWEEVALGLVPAILPCSQRHRDACMHTRTHTCTRTHTGANLGHGSSPWVHSARHTCLTRELAADGEHPS